MARGKLIVFDGTDGSGKATQAKLLVARLKKEGRKARTFDFPQYENNFFGEFIGECLAGEHGDFIAVDPYIASVLFAVDRFESKALLLQWLKEGYTVVLDRYVSSNQIHQGGKILEEKARKKFLLWLDKMEFEVLGLPRPDAIIYLDVPLAVTLALLQSKSQKQKKVYLKGKQKDQAESNPRHLVASKESALKLVKNSNHWLQVDCVEKGTLLSRKAIAKLVWEKIVNEEAL